jgi:hypothetical protein
MPAVTINAVSFAGDIFSNPTTVRRAPVEAKPIAIPVTNILIGRDGTRNKMDYGNKLRFELEWQKVPQFTRDALWAIRALSGTFAYVHIDSVSYTVQIETEGDYDEAVDHTWPSGARYYNIKLVLHQP